ncbi:hypothetical protein [Streptomyces huiliensis]|uniref:hypothetical protein n=1 Tax=Streptomyces huiliensis TaxID=2876027 RepID=UPI001CC13DDA|nr:hypothetical protein [Streptomyces huiliensis]MBZ4322966.1 hypothetical protein [Streptomyces huiliensis]
MFGRRGTAVVLGSLALVVSTFVAAPAGTAGTGADDGSVTCTGDATSRYDPPLTLQPRRTRNIAEVRYSCTTGPGRTVRATSTFVSTAPSASCLSYSPANGTETVRWADGARSVIRIDSATVVRVAGYLISEQSGRVVEGRGRGHAVRRSVTASSRQLPTDCLGSGLKGTTSGVQLEILP